MTLDTSLLTLRFDNIQSVKHVGLHLRNEVFTHGQLYETLSWCTSNLKIKVIFKKDAIDTYTMNIVYLEVPLE